MIFREFYPRGLTALDDFTTATLNTRPYYVARYRAPGDAENCWRRWGWIARWPAKPPLKGATRPEADRSPQEQVAVRPLSRGRSCPDRLRVTDFTFQTAAFVFLPCPTCETGEANTASRSRRAFHASFVINVSLSEAEGAVRPSREGAGPSQEGAQGRPGARCTRGLACKGR